MTVAIRCCSMRSTYSDADLGDISYHDVRVYGYAALPEVYEVRFDVDYLVEWLCPAQKNGPIVFRISPATLVFENAGCMDAALRAPQGSFSLNDLVRSDFVQLPGAAVGTWEYDLRGHDGSYVRLRASGFRLHLRADPIPSDQQQLSLKERGGISFRVPGE